MKVKAFAINLAKRKDRKLHIVKQFEKEIIVDQQVFTAIENTRGAIQGSSQSFLRT